MEVFVLAVGIVVSLALFSFGTLAIRTFPSLSHVLVGLILLFLAFATIMASVDPIAGLAGVPPWGRLVLSGVYVILGAYFLLGLRHEEANRSRRGRRAQRDSSHVETPKRRAMRLLASVVPAGFLFALSAGFIAIWLLQGS